MIGEWAIVAFDGGKLGGTGYAEWGQNAGSPLNIVLTGDAEAADYYVYDDPAVDDVLLVAADAMLPAGGGERDAPDCDILGYDCECEPKDAIDPFTRKPTFINEPGSDEDGSCYTFYGKNETGFEAIKDGYGFIREDANGEIINSWLPLPDGYWGHVIYLD